MHLYYMFCVYVLYIYIYLHIIYICILVILYFVYILSFYILYTAGMILRSSLTLNYIVCGNLWTDNVLSSALQLLYTYVVPLYSFEPLSYYRKRVHEEEAL
jgi:hypothetical protein